MLWRSDTRIGVASLLGGLFVVLVLGGQWALDPSIAAATSCTTNPQAQVEAQGINSNGNGYSNAIGEKTDIWINPSQNDTCPRVSSIGVMYTATGSVAEAGYWEQSGYSTTVFLAWWTPITGYGEKDAGSPGSADQYRTFRIQDLNQDGVWSAFIGSTNYDSTPNIGGSLVEGTPLDNGERHLSTDSEYAQFNNMEGYPANGAGYTYVYDITMYLDTDGSSGYNCIWESYVSNYVKQQTPTCSGY